MGLRARMDHNANQRANGVEPEPGSGRNGGYWAGVKRIARYLKRVHFEPPTIKNPERYLTAHQRRRLSEQKP